MWVKVADNLPHHRKLLGLSGNACWLLIASWAWCKSQGVDGEIPADALHELAPQVRGKAAHIAAKLLVERRWWHAVDGGGWTVHDWLDHNDDSSKVARLQKEDRERKRAAKVKGLLDSRRKRDGILMDSLRVPTGLRSDSASVPEVETETETETESNPPISPPAGGTDIVSTSKSKPVKSRTLVRAAASRAGRRFRPAPKPGKTEKARGGFGTRRPPGKPEPPPASAAAVALAATYRRLFAARFGTPAPTVPRDERTFDNLLRTHTADQLEPLLEGFLRNGTKWSREQHAWTPQVFEAQLGTLISLQSKGDL